MAALGRPGYINIGHGHDLNGAQSEQAMNENSHKVLQAAWDMGIRYFDTARSYGKGEEFLADWASKKPLGSLTIGSKWGYTYTANWQINVKHHEVKEHSLQKLNEQFDKSQTYLGKMLGLYQIHSATLESGVLDKIEVLDRLMQIKQQGICIGLSTSGEHQSKTIDKAIRIKVDGEQLFDTVQATFNLLETSAKASLEKAKAAGMGVIIKEVLANGRLTERNDGHDHHTTMTKLKNEADRHNTTIDALAMAYIIAHPFVDVVLSGATTVAQLISNLKATQVGISYDSMGRLAQMAVPAQAYWHTRKSLQWN